MTIVEMSVFAAFESWLKAHPQGGIFQYHGYVLRVEKR